MSEKKKLIPKRRFKEFKNSEAWEQRKLGEIIDSLYNGQTPSRSNIDNWNGDINWLTSGELTRGEVTKTIEKITLMGQKDALLKIVPTGTFLMAITGLEATGTRGNCAILAIDTTINQSCMAIFPNKTLLESSFLFQWYRKVGEKYGLRYTQGTKQQSYNAELIKILPITLPGIKEQNRISQFLESIDETITLQEKKLNKLISLKDSYLTELFPDEKHRKPSQRFLGFTEDWEQRKFKDFFNFPVSTNSLSRAQLNYENGNIKSVHYGDILVKYSSILNVKTDLIPFITDGVLEQYKSNLLKNGDIIFADAAEDETVGKAVEVSDIANENLVAGLHTIVARPKEKVAEYFLGYYINSAIYHKQLLRLMQGSKVSSISKGSLQVTDMSLPKNIEEQTKIGNFFKQLDETITLQECYTFLPIIHNYAEKNSGGGQISMSNSPKNASEASFQQNFVNELKKYKWEAPDFLNGNKQKVTVNDLINHWRKELNRINADQLEGIELTDDEFKQVLVKVGQISNSYEAAKLLAIEDSKGKIDGIYRDSNPKVTREQITLTIFKKAEVRGGDSSYKIAREVVSDNDNRFDLVLLINGLPLINIEQKRTDKSLNEAFGQFMRYYRDGEYINNFMAFSQMMVITTEIETRYFATPKSINDFNPAFLFKWSDKENNPINNWEKVIKHFLMIPMAHQMVGDYLVIDEARDEENRRHMLMRPYQVYALQAIEGAAFGWDNESKIPHGGFVWHTTGSGKTITSFKTALFLSTRAGFDKVVFLVDRRELDNRTSENFKAYAAYESVDVDDTKATYQLRKQLRLAKSGIVVTTTFKLNSLVKELEEAHDDSLSKKRIVFIIDEAHRTTMGQMMGNIKKYFKRNGLFYGFTGTPLFDENQVKGKINEKSELINTTEKLFGPELHKYTIDEAISDGNVLGFHVDYINTGEFKSYEDLREKLIKTFEDEHPEQPKREIEHKVQVLTDLEIEKLAIEKELLIYQDETHIPQVVEEILANWEYQSQNGEFNAILAVAYKKRVIDYFDEFKKQISNLDTKPNIAMTFSFGNENDPDNVSPDVIKRMFKDYASFTGIEFVSGDKKHGEEAYFEDLVDRTTRGGSGRNKKNIDIVIVAKQLLTGYDSKRLNTLYVDCSLELQGLIQAYSRTNRIFGSTKEFGTIINFQYPKITEEMVNTALKLYGSGGKNSPAIVDLYETAVKKLRLEFDNLIPTLPDPTEWEMIDNDPIAKETFKLTFIDAASQLNFVKQYYEYIWDEVTFGLTEHNWLQYVGAFKNLFPPGPGPEPEPIKQLEGKTKLVGTQVIDAPHILSLIDEKVILEDGKQTIDSETLRIVHEQIQELSNMGEASQARLLKQFVDNELVPKKISSELNFDEAYDKWKKDQQDKEVTDFADEWGIQSDLLIRSVTAYSISQPDVIPYIDEITQTVNFEQAKNQEAGNKLRHNMKLMSELPHLVAEVMQKYK